jgi:hypothetical protein
MTDQIDKGLRGRYAPRTDHLSFTHRIPDDFPYIELSVTSAEMATPMASLLDEFVHRAQWSLTAVGMAYRIGCHVQVLHTLELLRLLASDPSLRVATPWLTADLPADPEAARHLTAIRAIESTQRYLLGQALGHPLDLLPDALHIARAALADASPLTFGTFGTFGSQGLYDESGRPEKLSSTLNILESHASTFAVELLRGVSPKRAQRWLDEYVTANHVDVYRTIQELATAASSDADTYSLLRLSDWALACPLTHVYGVPPPPDYLESAVPYSRFFHGLRQLPARAEAFHRLGVSAPTTRQVVEAVISAYGDIRPAFVNVPPDRRKEIDVALRDVDEWQRRQLSTCNGPDILTSFTRLITIAIAQTVQRYLAGLREIPRDAMMFEPTQERLARMCAICDFPVIVYPDGFEVFLCEPNDDPELELKFRTTVFGITAAARALHAPAAAQPEHLPFDLASLLEWSGVTPDQVRLR